MGTACLLLVLLVRQDLREIEKVLEAAVDTASYEKGAYAAARELAQASGPAAMRLRIELYDQKLDTYRGVMLRDWFYTGMCAATSLDETALLVAAAADRRRSDDLRLLALRALEKCPGSVDAKKLLHAGFRSLDGELARQWQVTLATAYLQERLAARGTLQNHLEGTVRSKLERAGPPYTGLAALGELSRDEWEQVFEAATRARAAGDRAEALRALADGPAELFLEAVESGLEDEAIGPRVAAVESCVAARSAPAVPILLQALESEVAAGGGRLVSELGNALMSLTGQELGYGPTLWRRWWNDRGQTFLENGAAPLRERAGANRTVAKLFGLAVDSKRVAIVVDASGSMRMGKIGERSCAEAAARELGEFLARLPSGAVFTLTMVADEPVSAFERPMRADKSGRLQAVRYLEQYGYGGTSALYDVLVWVMNHSGMDTVLLVSDGGSSSGRHHQARAIRDGLRREYARTGVRIHGICVSSDSSKIRLLADLAGVTGGRAVAPATAEAPTDGRAQSIRRMRARASRLQESAGSGAARNGFRSNSRISGQSESMRFIRSRISTSCSRSTPGLPRAPSSSACARMPSTISRASASESGCSRNTTSLNTSTCTPPRPKASMRPTCGSLAAPKNSSTPAVRIGCTRTSAAGWALPKRASSSFHAASNSSGPRTSRTTAPCSLLCSSPEPITFSATGQPIRPAASSASSVPETRRLGATGMP